MFLLDVKAIFKKFFVFLFFSIFMIYYLLLYHLLCRHWIIFLSLLVILLYFLILNLQSVLVWQYSVSFLLNYLFYLLNLIFPNILFAVTLVLLFNVFCLISASYVFLVSYFNIWSIKSWYNDLFFNLSSN